jgi:tetratricopeptide (TPR) repeat protein
LFACSSGVSGPDEFSSRLRTAVQLQRAGDYAAAEKLLREEVQQAEASKRVDVGTALVFNNLGSAYHYQNRYKDAEYCFRRAIDICQTGCEEVFVVRFTVNLAQVYLDTGQPARAERLNLDSLLAGLREGSKDAPDVVRLVVTIGVLADLRGRYTESERTYKELLLRAENLRPYGEDTWLLLHNLGLLCHKTGRSTEAMTYYERALLVAEKAFRPEDPRLAKLLLTMGTLQLKEHGPADAEPFYQRALAAGERALGPEHPLVRQILADYALALRRMKRSAKAREYERRAKKIPRASSEADPSKYTVDISDLIPRQ